MVAMVITSLLLVCMLLGAWAGYISPRTWALPSMLCLVFPVLWCLSLGAGVLWLIFCRDKVYAIVCGAALLLSLPTMLQVSPLRFPSGLKPGETPLTLLTYNVAHFKDLEHGRSPYSRTCSYILDSDADIVCMQEHFSLDVSRKRGEITAAQVDSLKAKYPYMIFGHDEEESLFSKYPATYVSGYSSVKRYYFNYQLYHIDVKGRTFSLLNVHLSSYKLSKDQRALASHLKDDPTEVLDKEENVSLYRKLRSAFCVRAKAAEQLKELCDSIQGPLIVCGDFNDVPGSYAWHTIRSAGLDDAYCATGFGPMITYNAGHMFFHIDQVLYRPDTGIRPYEVSRGSLRSSDHYPVTTRFALDLDKMK